MAALPVSPDVAVVEPLENFSHGIERYFPKYALHGIDNNNNNNSDNDNENKQL